MVKFAPVICVHPLMASWYFSTTFSCLLQALEAAEQAVEATESVVDEAKPASTVPAAAVAQPAKEVPKIEETKVLHATTLRFRADF